MKKIWSILGKFGIAAGTVATLYGAFSLLDGIRDDVSDTKEMVIYNNKQIEGVSQQMYNLQDTAEEIQAKQIQQGEKIKDLTWIVRHRNNYTDEQLGELMDMMMRRSYVVSPVEAEVSESEPVERIIPHYEGEVECIPIDTLPNP